ncbi:HD domain-containing protein [Sphingomonas sp. LHG3406-1]|uniref:HD domain-containing protein n=1 Tax=Sphingomonas sp. LHG3406-1 TaxID=2804617 RepID=UPI00262583BA|nr:HD domain-containing protein [Sphingomonas sp. LHG3406-1]
MTKLTRRFEEALLYASAVHGGQKRKGTSVPYIAHLLGVTAIALELGADEDQAVAALLHDAVEDQGGQGRLDDIRNRFGERVAHIVQSCTDADVQPKPPWRERKETYISALPYKQADALLVSLADKIHNAEAILADVIAHGPKVWDRFKGGEEGTKWYYRELTHAFCESLPGPGADRLQRASAAMQAATGVRSSSSATG